MLLSGGFALQADAFSFSDLFSLFFKPKAIQNTGVFSLPAKQEVAGPELSAQCVKLLEATALGRKYLTSWGNPELQGYCKFLQKFPGDLGNAVINVMREKWYSDNAVLSAVELDAEGNFKNFFKKSHPITVIAKRFDPEKTRTVDGVFDLPRYGQQFHAKAKALNSKLRSWSVLKAAILSQAKYFEYSSLGGILDNTIVIELRNGTTLDKRATQAAIWYAFDDDSAHLGMRNVSRVGIYNTKKDSVLLYSRYDWLGRERP